jgi:hypothetical protein
MDMSMEKVSAQKLLYMFADYKDWSVCPFFMLALYRISGNGKRHFTSGAEDDHWIFPNLALACDPVRKMNSTLRSLVSTDNNCSPSVPGLTNDYTGTGFRIGSINTILGHPSCDIKHAVMRSGHDHKNACSVFEYMYAQPALVATAGRALQEYPSATNRSPQPRLVFLNDQNQTLIINFMRELLLLDEVEFFLSGKLWEFGKCLFATFLMHYDQYQLTMAANHPTIVRVQSTCKKFKISLQQLCEWGKLVKQDFHQKNVTISATQEHDSLSSIIVTWLKSMEHKVTDMTLHLSSLDRRLTHLQDTVATLSCQNHIPVQTTSRKRSKVMNDLEVDSGSEAGRGHAINSLVDSLSMQTVNLEENISSLEDCFSKTADQVNDLPVNPQPTPPEKIVQTPLYECTSMANLHIADAFQTWFAHQLHLNRFHPSVSKQTKSAYKKLVPFMISLLTPEEASIIEKIPPEPDSPNFSQHSIVVRKIAQDVSKRTMEKVAELETGSKRAMNDVAKQKRTVTALKPTITAVIARMKTFQTDIPKDQTSILNLMKKSKGPGDGG